MKVRGFFVRILINGLHTTGDGLRFMTVFRNIIFLCSRQVLVFLRHIRKSELIIAFFVFEDGIVFGDQMDRAGLFAEPVVRFERNQKELALCETTTSAQMTLLISNPSAIFSFSLQQKNREKLHIRIECGMKTNPKQHNNLSKRLQNAFKQYMICSLKEYLNGCIDQIARTANVFNELLDQQ